MRRFIVIWAGQLASHVGSYLTTFALAIWAFERTGLATTLTGMVVVGTLAQVGVLLLGGALVDRFSRKAVILVANAGEATAALAILALLSTEQLAVWHLFVIRPLFAGLDAIQLLAFTASAAVMVPPRQYGRVGSLRSLLGYASDIAGPALAGGLYPFIGLAGILAFDLVAFALGFATVLGVAIPRAAPREGARRTGLAGHFRDLPAGFAYIWRRPPLRLFVGAYVLFILPHDFVNSLQTPLILARTGNDVGVRAGVSLAAGLAGVLSGVVTSAVGGPVHRVRALLLTFIGAGLAKMAFGLVRTPPLWFGAQFCSSLNFPPMEAARSGVEIAKIDPAMQGRVFAAITALVRASGTLAALAAGPLADAVFEPAMRPGGGLVPLLGGVFGDGPGAGMAVLHAFVSLGMIAIGAGGFLLPALRDAERALPNAVVVLPRAPQPARVGGAPREEGPRDRS